MARWWKATSAPKPFLSVTVPIISPCRVVWSHGIGKLDDCGCAWTGQPLVVQGDEGTKAIMNLYGSKKAKENLVEVICATLDGRIYDLDDGTKPREAVKIGLVDRETG